METHTAQELQRQSLSSQIAERLIEQIVHQGIREGETLPSEQQLACDYNVSRQIVREALKSLEGRGYVRIERGRGAVVLEPQSELLQNFFIWVLHGESKRWVELTRVRRVLEIESARGAAVHRTEADLEAIRAVLEDMASHTEDSEEYNRLDIRFHVAIAHASANSFMVYLIESIRGALMTILRHLRLNLRPDMVPAIQQNHQRIYDAIRAADPDESAAAMAAHFDEVIERLELLRRSAR